MAKYVVIPLTQLDPAQDDPATLVEVPPRDSGGGGWPLMALTDTAGLDCVIELSPAEALDLIPLIARWLAYEDPEAVAAALRAAMRELSGTSGDDCICTTVWRSFFCPLHGEGAREAFALQILNGKGDGGGE